MALVEEQEVVAVALDVAVVVVAVVDFARHCRLKWLSQAFNTPVPMTSWCGLS